MRQANAPKPVVWRSAYVLLAALGVICMSRPARADSIALGPGGSGLLDNIKVMRIDGDQIIFEGPSGESRRTISDKMVLKINTEPVFSEAETLFAEGKFADAADRYIKVMGATQATWVKQWAARRAMIAAEQSQRFDVEVSAWVYFVQANPTDAQRRIPKIPSAGSTYINTAISAVDSAVGRAKTDAEKAAYLNYLLQLQTAAKDDAGAAKTAAALQKLSGNVGSANVAENAAQTANTAVTLALHDLETKNFKAALERIETNKQIIVDADLQARALWVRAEAKAALAGDTKDVAVLQDITLDYMRLVANFPNSPNAAAALLKAGILHERMGEKETAQQVYQQVATGYAPENPAVQLAKQNLERIKNGGALPK